MKARSGKISKVAAFLAGVVALSLNGTAIGSDHIRIPGHIPHGKQLRQSSRLGRLASRTSVSLAFTMKPRNPAGLADLANRIYDPADPEYGHFLTSSEFNDRFAPSETDVNEVVAYLRYLGFRSASVHPNGLMIDAIGSAGTVESAFAIQLHEYQTPDGQRVHAPSQDPELREDIAARLIGVSGLSTFRHARPHLSPNSAASSNLNPDLYLTPPKIKTAYKLSQSSTAGLNETIALFELDGFSMSDVTAYEDNFSIPHANINTILVDGVSGSAGADANEVTLDIELVTAVSAAATINIYEGPNTDVGVLHTYNRIATDNTAKIVSTSWGSSESGVTQSFLDAENTIFQQMAVQGQSVFAASGDAGAYDDSGNPSLLTVDDPGAQPYVTAVGGTTLNLNIGSYFSESSWGTSSNGQGGGGGMSAVWQLPSWQAGLATSVNKGSNSRRMVPDVALASNPSTGYSVFFGGTWHVFGGTSAAAPLWAAFTAQVNQARVAAGLTRLGFANPAIYQVAQSSLYTSTFHDISDGSTNLYFPSTSGYDLSTGWGSLQGSALLSALSAATLPPYPPTTVSTSGSAGLVAVNWSSVSGAVSYTVFRSNTFNGSYVALSHQAGTSFTETVGSSGYYYYVTATNSAGTSGPSAKRAGAAPLAAPTAASGITTGGGT
jgi:subtilase family serine protease